MTAGPGVKIIARTVRGLEWFAAAELCELSTSATSRPVIAGRREVVVELAELDPALLRLNTVDDVFVEVGRVCPVAPTRQALPAIAAMACELDWRTPLGRLGAVNEVPTPPRFDVVASLEGRHAYNRYELADAIGDALARRLPGEYLSRSGQRPPAGEPDLTVRVFVRDAAAVLAVRLTARPLHRRAYKLDTAPGTLHPPAAAALVRLAVPPDGIAAPSGRPEVIADPFCGDGTIAIEAGRYRPFARVLASDIDQHRLDNAARNAQRAAVQRAGTQQAGTQQAGAQFAGTQQAGAQRAWTQPELARADAGARWSPTWPMGGVDMVVTNPPWNVAVDAGGRLRNSLDPFWRRVPELLRVGGRLGVIAEARLDAAEALQRTGFRIAPPITVRLAGRVSTILLCAAPGEPAPAFPPALAEWRERAVAAGLITDDGFA